MIRAPRLLALVQALRRHRRPVTGEALAVQLEVSVRTIYRDIAALVASGLPIRGEAGVGYVLGEGYDLPPMMFSIEEVEAIALGLRWLASNAAAPGRLAEALARGGEAGQPGDYAGGGVRHWGVMRS